MKWMLIFTALWGDSMVGGEGKYVGGPYSTLPECLLAASAGRPQTTTLVKEMKIIKVECVLRDDKAMN